jgi:predicted AlkP superfamily pyrophosphatase or phosphodiesterase
MKKNLLFFALTVILLSSCKKDVKPATKPKLVVGIVIDQMRYDYLTRYLDRFGEGGFKRLLNNGYSLENAHYNYIPTYTAVGHSSIYTGTTPDNHGIIANNWYDKFLKKSVYCVDDNNYKTIGNTTKNGQKSPYRLFTTTLTDELHLAQNMKGKTIGIGIKDRSAILPAGHTANAAYWYDGGNNNQWISSSFYMKELPNWVKAFNKNNKADEYLNKDWTLLYDKDTYTNSREDDNVFEGKFKGEKSPTFPHKTPDLRKLNDNFSHMKYIPAGNTFTVDFAKQAIVSEDLGKGEFTDFLALSFSSTDYVGHRYGVFALETEDTYLRLDKDLEDFFNFLDTNVGKGNYTLFLTSDHAVVPVPSYLQSLKIPAHYFKTEEFKKYVNSVTTKYFKSDDLVENFSNNQIFLNKETLDKLKLDKNIVAEKIADEVVYFDGVYKAVSAKTLQTTSYSDGILRTLQKGYNQKLSGDVLLIPYPATLTSKRTGTSHGSGYFYDTHVPILFYGNGITKGASAKRYEIIDIAPTIANLLDIEAPNASTGKVIEEVLEK